MGSRIGIRIILAVGMVTVVMIGTLAVLIVRAHRAALIAELHRSADQLSETIKSSTLHDMLENKRENLHRQIETIGGQQGIRNVRVYNKEGRIVFSSDESEVGHSVDKKAEACYACHAVDQPLASLPIRDRARVFRGPAGEHLLGIINPIHNRPSCTKSDCHAHGPHERVLGVLDLTMSLAAVDHSIVLSQWRLAGMTAAVILASSLILFWLNRRLVVKPVEALSHATRRVSQGDLATRIPVTASHELGDLARAFNEMIARLAEDQRQIMQADKLASLGRLAAGVAHEINNPLTGVLTYASFLLKRSQDNPELHEDLEVVVRETKRCREIVRNLLDFARQTPPERRPTELNEVVRRAVSIVTNQLSLKRVDLSIDLAERVPTISADSNRLQQVFVNLLVNAADAAPDTGGRVKIVTRTVERPPKGLARIGEALCPCGCSLLDARTRIRLSPAIRVLRSAARRESLEHLDPLYGSSDHEFMEAHADGEVAEFFCPNCHVSLDAAAHACPACGAGLFGVQVPDRGIVHWCRRSGCRYTHWDAEERRGLRVLIEVTVEDNGPGIAAVDLEHLFEPFFTTKGSRGTGLGLAVSWGIIDGHGGTIDVASVENVGSRFTVRLPVADDATPGGPL